MCKQPLSFMLMFTPVHVYLLEHVGCRMLDEYTDYMELPLVECVHVWAPPPASCSRYGDRLPPFSEAQSCELRALPQVVIDESGDY